MSDGDSIIALAKQHIGEEYIFGARAPMNNPNWKGPWDCAEFVSWCVFQATTVLYGTSQNNNPRTADAYTGYWANQSRNDDARISVRDAAGIVGACVLRIPRSGQVGHIVFSDGQGGTVEARGKRYGVVEHTLSGRRWDTGVLVPGVNYLQRDRPVVIDQPPIIIRLTSPMTRGPLVTLIQEALASKGFDPGPIDGIYGRNTMRAVEAYQKNNGLVPDGEVGPQTSEILGIELR